MWLQITSGYGPIECERAVFLFTQSILQELKESGITAALLSVQIGEQRACFRSALIGIEDDTAQERLNLTGTILWTCKSPFRTGHARKNWYIHAEIIAISTPIGFDEQAVRFETMRSSGPGGQNVNKVETAVRALYPPLNLCTVASEERSQHANKKLALARLCSAVESANAQAKAADKKERRKAHTRLTRGNEIRAYRGEAFIRIG